MDEPIINYSKEPDEITFREIVIKVRAYLTYLKTKWKIIAAITLVGGLIGFGLSYMKKTSYSATLSFALEDEKVGSGGGIIGLASQLGFDAGSGSAGGAFSGGNLVELMKSRSLIQKALLKPIAEGKEISLADYYVSHNIGGLKDKWKKNSALHNVRFAVNADERKFTLEQNLVIKAIYNHILSKILTVGQKDKKSSITYIDVKAEDELFAKVFTETIANVVSDFYVETKSKKSQLNLAILQKQTDSMRAELNSSMLGVAAANDNTFNLNPALNIKRFPSSRRQVDVQANIAMLTQLVQNLEIAKVSLRKETPLIQVIDVPVLPLTQEGGNPLRSFLTDAIIAFFLSVFFLVARKWWKGIIQ